MGGPSKSEQQLQAEQAQQTADLIAQQNTLFAEQQDLLSTLKPLLEQEIANPVGFTAQELADLNANNVNTTGAQYANIQKQLNLRNASANATGLPSGVAAGENAALASAAAGTVASNANQIQLENAALATQKQQTAQNQLLSLESGTSGAAIGTGNVANTAENNAFNQAYTMQQQSSSLMSGLLGGLINTGIGVAGSGVSMLGSGNFGW